MRPTGYGAIGLSDGRVKVAHRVAYELIHGCTVPRGIDVMHSCDNRRCCRPSHLSLGTRLDNMRDAAEKGRTRRGTDHCNAKLTDSLVREIRSLHVPRRVGVRKIAALLGLTRSSVHGVIHCGRWKHVK